MLCVGAVAADREWAADLLIGIPALARVLTGALPFQGPGYGPTIGWRVRRHGGGLGLQNTTCRDKRVNSRTIGEPHYPDCSQQALANFGARKSVQAGLLHILNRPRSGTGVATHSKESF